VRLLTKTTDGSVHSVAAGAAARRGARVLKPAPAQANESARLSHRVREASEQVRIDGAWRGCGWRELLDVGLTPRVLPPKFVISSAGGATSLIPADGCRLKIRDYRQGCVRKRQGLNIARGDYDPNDS